MTKPKVDWWSSQDLVSRGSMCNTDHHFQVKTKVSPVNWKGWQVRNTSSIYIHLILNKVIVNGHWPLRCDNRSHSVPHSNLIASDRPCAHCAWRRYFHQFIFLAAWTMHFSVKRNFMIFFTFCEWLWVYIANKHNQVCSPEFQYPSSCHVRVGAERKNLNFTLRAEMFFRPTPLVCVPKYFNEPSTQRWCVVSFERMIFR